MKTISHYRQAGVNKKTKSTTLMALIIAAAFVAGVLVGTAVPVADQGAAAVAAGAEHLKVLFQGSIKVELALLADTLTKMGQVSLSGLDPNLEYALTGP